MYKRQVLALTEALYLDLAAQGHGNIGVTVAMPGMTRSGIMQPEKTGPAALQAYDQRLCADVSALVLRNRGSGPFGILGLVDERCGGGFDNIDDVIPAAEREAFMARYKAAAGFAIETLNAAPPTIAPGARVAGEG